MFSCSGRTYGAVGMESTLSVTDVAYNSGRRSRASSFHSEAAGAAYGTGELSPGPRPDLSSGAFRDHRRHESDASDLVAAVTPNSNTFGDDSLHQHLTADLSPSATSPAFLDKASHSRHASLGVQGDDKSLDEAFNSSLFMLEDYPGTTNGYPGPYHDDEQWQQAHQQQQSYGTNMDQSFEEMLEQVPSLPNAYLNANGTTFSTYPAHMSSDRGQSNPYPAAVLGGLPPYEKTLMMQHGTAEVGPGTRPRMPDFGHDQGEGDAELERRPRRQVQSTTQAVPQSMLEVPGGESFSQATLDVPSPFSEQNSFDGSSFGDLGSPSVGPLTLSRSNSFTSQNQQVYDNHHIMSAPDSPFAVQENFLNSQNQNRAGLYSNPYDGMSAAPHGYAFLQPQMPSQYDANLHPGMYDQAQGIFAIPQSMEYANTFETPPDIAINPPTPSTHSYMSRAAHPTTSYPFPHPVPAITTTTAPAVPMSFAVPQGSSDSLGVGSFRGRSHSDSRLMVQSGLSPSRSRSSHETSSSDRARSRSRSRTPGGRLLNHDRSTRPADHSRRASWNGINRKFVHTDPEEEEEMDLEDGPDGSGGSQQVYNKQKNPATFICPVEGCHKAFTRAYNLRSHQRTHTNERPFLCEICSKGFARQHDRKRHEKLHTNEKPFSCPGCLKKFARMDALSRHFKSETGKDCIVGNPEYEHFLSEEDG